MEINNRASTGLMGFDKVIDNLRLGDNVVWQVDSVSEYRKMVDFYVKHALKEKRRLVYVRFGIHESILEESPDIKTYHVDPSKGFESFATEVHNLVADEERKTFYGAALIL